MPVNKLKAAAAALLALGATPSAGQVQLTTAGVPAGTPARGATGQLTQFGNIDVRSTYCTLEGSALVWHDAHLVAQNGTTMDADIVRANLGSKGGNLQTVVASGHVKTYLDQSDLHRTYTVTTDKAVYNPATQRIDMTGNVKAVITSAYTSGPLVQTGDTGIIKLGPAPDYPQITMNNVHTTFTPEPVPPAAAPGHPPVTSRTFP